MASFCHLPKEVMEEIMLFVPADSLVQLKRVNKCWYSIISALINDTTFVAKHLLITRIQSSPSLLFNLPSHSADHQLITLPLLNIFNDDDDNNDHFFSVTEALNLPVNWNPIYQSWDIHHCDGILCLVHKTNGTMILFNPALQESRILPKSKNAIDCRSPIVIGFGYDSRANDYKVVAIWFPFGGLAKVEVYTMGFDSWREINFSEDLSDCIEDAFLDGVFLKGIFYWLLHSDAFLEEVCETLCFNLCNEEFDLIQHPDLEDFPLTRYWCSLFVWNDSVALCLSDEREYHFFVMDDNGKGACSWTKRLIIGPLVNDMRGLSLWRNDEFLMIVKEGTEQRLVSYNLLTQKFRDIVAHDIDINRIEFRWDCCFYGKSLVSVRRR